MTTDEVARRLVHASGAILPAFYLADVATWNQVRGVALVATSVGLVLEGLRLYGPEDWAVMHTLDRVVYRRLIREYERTNPGGYLLYLVGGTTVAVGFQPRIAVPAFLMLAIADPLSGMLGSGGLRGAKRPFVMAITFGVSFGLAISFVPVLPAVLGALAATIADGVKPVVAGYVLDDNLTIPIGAAVAIWLGLQVAPVPIV